MILCLVEIKTFIFNFVFFNEKRNPFSFNKDFWKDDVTKKEKFWWITLLSVIYSGFISTIVYDIFIK